MVEEALTLYAQGWFPMAESFDARPDRVEWVQPAERSLIPLDTRFHVPKSLAQRIRSGRFVVRHDTAFPAVIRACAVAKRRDVDGTPAGTWLHPSIIRLFELFHRVGCAHSIEAWRRVEAVGDDRVAHAVPTAVVRAFDGVPHVLVGGLYGVAIGSAFCGESMFSRADLGGTDASRVCLVHLVEHLRHRGFTLLDAQLANPHLAQFGSYEIEQAAYLEMLAAAATMQREW
jgi:leucyl/phenylalanyl-tRNA--protein transferase